MTTTGLNTPQHISTGHRLGEKAEKKRNKLNLQPALKFVGRHLDRYNRSYGQLIAREPCGSKQVDFSSVGLVTRPQVLPGEIEIILDRMPVSLLKLSLLRSVDYRFSSTVPVPVFNQDGDFSGDADMVPVQQFPRVGDHPSRILIGYSSGEVIYPSALPPSIHGGELTRWFYQLHVFLHEFFHTIEYLRRDHGVRQNIVLVGEKMFTLEEWWLEWENLFGGMTQKPRCPTRYAAVYRDSLTPKVREKHPEEFTKALAEQICESFVGYILGIVPNDEDNESFRDHSPQLWSLMDKLATASVRS